MICDAFVLVVMDKSFTLHPYTEPVWLLKLRFFQQVREKLINSQFLHSSVDVLLGLSFSSSAK